MRTDDRSQQELARKIDRMIEKHIAESDERDERGVSMVAISTSEKLRWANEAGVGLGFVDARLEANCEEVPVPDPYVAVARYRMKRGAEGT